MTTKPAQDRSPRLNHPHVFKNTNRTYRGWRFAALLPSGSRSAASRSSVAAAIHAHPFQTITTIIAIWHGSRPGDYDGEMSRAKREFYCTLSPDMSRVEYKPGDAQALTAQPAEQASPKPVQVEAPRQHGPEDAAVPQADGNGGQLTPTLVDDVTAAVVAGVLAD